MDDYTSLWTSQYTFSMEISELETTLVNFTLAIRAIPSEYSMGIMHLSVLEVALVCTIFSVEFSLFF
jgi:hypothetical protein